MMQTMMRLLVLLLFTTGGVAAFAPAAPSSLLSRHPPSTSCSSTSRRMSLVVDTGDSLLKEKETTSSQLTRRDIFTKSAVALLTASTTTTTLSSLPANAAGLPTVTADEFYSILRDSARSITRVEFSGPLNDVVTVELVDGTQFGISDVVESSTDPRSPLKIAAYCREFDVKTKFTSLEAILAKTPKKKKVYANARELEAAAREKERLARIAADEQERLEELAKMEQQQEAQ